MDELSVLPSTAVTGAIALQFADDGVRADVSGVQDVADPGEKTGDSRVKKTVRVGNDAYLHKENDR